jgi:hypothetical protein
MLARLRGFETGVCSSVSRLVRISIDLVPDISIFVFGNVDKAALFLRFALLRPS